MMFEKAKKKYAICIICISLTDLPEPPLVRLQCSIILNTKMILQLGVLMIMMMIHVCITHNDSLYFSIFTETMKFYKALSQVGTDFSLMVPLFPKRKRKELKVRNVFIIKMQWSISQMSSI
jgi:hypothetical protein